MNNKIKISVVQTDLAWENVARNLELLGDKIRKADDSDIYVLPEVFTTGFTNNLHFYNHAETEKTILWMQEMASVKNAAICGSIIFKEHDKFFNRFIFVEPDGKIHSYDKRHLFGFGGEKKIFSEGSERIVVEYKSFKILLLVCYDLRFPVWSRNVDNYDAVFYVANWPSPRRSMWDLLLKARAIENQCFVVGVNRIGVDGNNLIYNGGSCIVNYLGECVVKVADDKEDIVSMEINKDELMNFRNYFPVLNDMDKFKIELG